jgi:hypothetical protein
MTDYEIRDLAATATSNIIELTGMQGDYIAIYLSVVFAFIVASFVAGRDFNKVQTTVATLLFCIVCGWLVNRITMLGLGINFLVDLNSRENLSLLIEEGQGGRDFAASGVRVLVTSSIWSLGMVGALIFLWDVRHRKNH